MGCARAPESRDVSGPGRGRQRTLPRRLLGPVSHEDELLEIGETYRLQIVGREAPLGLRTPGDQEHGRVLRPGVVIETLGGFDDRVRPRLCRGVRHVPVGDEVRLRQDLEHVADHGLVGEIRKGVQLLRKGEHRERLKVWLQHDLPDWFGDRLLTVSLAVADRWGALLAEIKRPAPAIDSLLAATALHHNLRVVTRNEDDFTFPELDVVNPWST